MDLTPGGLGPRNADDLMRTANLIHLSFFAAAEAWLETRRYHLAPVTLENYAYYIKEMYRFFGDVHVQDITGDMVRMYQSHRRKVAGADLINKELGVLTQIRQRMGMPLHDYQRLPKDKNWEPSGRALDADEEQRVRKACKDNIEHPKWDMAAICTLLSLCSGMGPGEMLSLKLKHCSLDPAKVVISRSGAKRIKRERVVMLGELGAWALRKGVERAANKCGCLTGDHYLFCFQNKNKTFDPSKPAKGYRGGMKGILLVAGVKMRRYDCRHTAGINAFADPTIAKQDILEHFGWSSDKMIPVYYHPRVSGLKNVAMAIERKPVQNDNYISKLLKTS